MHNRPPLGQASDSPERPSDLAGSGSTWPPISDYAIIGDCRSAALVSNRGSIEWLCWPRFDSASIFAAILDRHRGGHWAISPPADQILRISRQYEAETNVLHTTFHCHSGIVVLTDLMPVASERAKRSILVPDHEILRQVRCTQGEARLDFDFYPRPNYGASNVKLRRVGALGIRFDVGPGAYWLRSSVPLNLVDGRAEASLRLSSGDDLQFSLTYGEESPQVLPPLGLWIHQRITESIDWWKSWSACAKYDGPQRDSVLRSALTLKLLTYAPSGAIIAEPTTSLPERIGGSLNWDYRFCWLRDASLTVRALLGLGYDEEAESFLSWLLHATRLTQPELRILYNIFGGNTMKERQLEHLSGYRDSRPVRIGNAARGQVQLDVYGEVVDAAAQIAYHHGPFERVTQEVLVGIGKYVASHWNQPDQGIWEPREHPDHHTHSRVLCWTALDRLVTLAEKKLLPNAPVAEFKRERDRIAQQVKSQAWNSAINSYVSTLNGNELDASLLLLSYYGFEAANCSRMQSTYRAIRSQLRAGRNLLYRYLNGSPEGSFGICSFWEVEYLALGGASLDHATHLFEELLQYRNDVGLFAEEVDPRSGAALGNFPQAFTHVGLISAALSITEKMKGAKQLPHRENSAKENKAA
jgi:GH15 family glucan-1,4-alpha-glucosidase